MSLANQSAGKGAADNVSSNNAVAVQHGQVVAHLIILLICATMFGLTFQFEEVPPMLQRGMAPESFPRGVSLLAFLLTVMSLLRSFFGGTVQKNTDLPAEFYLSIMGCVVFLVIANIVDLLIAMVLFIASICWLWGERRRWVVIVLSIALPAVIFVLFSELLGIRFPRGVLINLIYG